MEIKSNLKKSIRINNGIIEVRTGWLAGDAAIGVGIGLTIASVVGYPYSLVLLIPAAYISFTTYGVKINPVNNQLKDYFKHFGIFETGKWRANPYVHVSILGSRVTHGGLVAFSWFFNFRNYHTSNKISIVLLDKYHVKRLELCEADTVESAEEIAKILSETIKLPVMKFNPVRLTKERRR